VVGAQIPVCDVVKRNATAIDVLCETQEGHYVVVEIKTRLISLARHTEEYARVNAFEPVVKSYKVPNSLYYRHQVQLAQTTAMFRKSKLAKKKGTPVHALILVLIENQAVPYFLRPELGGLKVSRK